MSGHDLIVLGASNGGLQTLLEIARSLNKDVPATQLVVVSFMRQMASEALRDNRLDIARSWESDLTKVEE